MQYPEINSSKTIHQLLQHTTGLEEDAEDLRDLAGYLQTPPASLEDLIFRLYLEAETVAKTATALREMGIRTPQDRSFQADHVSEFIRNATPQQVGNEVLHWLVTSLFAEKRIISSRAWN